MTNDSLPMPLVSVDWLMAKVQRPGLAVIDASWYLPNMGRDCAAEYLAGHIPGAAFFDIDAIADHSTGLPHMLPSADFFARSVEAMGVGDETDIVIYDAHELFSAPRLWWMFHVFGHANVAVLDGGLNAWKRLGGPLEAGAPRVSPGHFTPRPNAALVADLEIVRSALEQRTAQVLDARPAARFFGQAPEPRPGVRSGHMPGSRSLPASDMVRDGQLKSPAEIEAAFAAARVDWSQPVIASCGSGVTAAILTFALARIGKPMGQIYDGSWSEWGAKSGLPVATL